MFKLSINKEILENVSFQTIDTMHTLTAQDMLTM